MEKKFKAAEDETRSEALLDRQTNEQRQVSVADQGNSAHEFRRSVPDATAKDVTNLVTLIQYFDMLKKMGLSSRINTISTPRSSGSLSMLTEQDRNGMIDADLTAEAPVTALTRISSDESRAYGQSHLRDLAKNIKGNSNQKSTGMDDNDNRE
jgi:hypothetical protein